MGLRDRFGRVLLRSGGPLLFHAPIVASIVSVRAIYHKVIGEPAQRESAFMKVIRLLGVIIGILIIVFLIREVGWDKIRHSLGMLGWGYGVVLVYPLSWILLNTAGWRMALHKQYSHQRLFKMAQIRLAGETFNSMLPSGYIGGEPLKAKLLSKWIPMHESASSVLIAKAAQSIGLVLFVGLGLIFGGNKKQHSILHHPATLLSLVLLTTGIVIFTVLFTRRSFSRFGLLASQSHRPSMAAETGEDTVGPR